MPTRRSAPTARHFVFAIALVVITSGCSGGGSQGSDAVQITGTTPRSSSTTASTAIPTTASTTALGDTSGAGSSDPQLSTLDVDSPIACRGESATATVRYTTVNATTVAFLVDDKSASGTPPLSGSFEVTLPCDGNAHTIIAVAVGPSGQSLGTKAVLTDRQD